MTSDLRLVTGATGLIGSHVAELLVSHGHRVRALVRPGSNTRFLEQLGVELVRGDLGKPDSLLPAVNGVATVYHCAALVGDWGSWSLFQQGIVDATDHLLAACRQSGLPRLLHVSSINVYGRPRLGPDEWLTEDSPLAQNVRWGDYYCRAKILAEELVRAYPGAWTIVRPSWTYGPRDRNSFPRVRRTVLRGWAMVVGKGDNLLNIIHAADIADGIVRAATSPVAIGQAYNLSSEGMISQREFLDALTDGLGKPRTRRRLPFWLAYTGGLVSEIIGKLIRLKRPPVMTRYAVRLIGRTTRYSIAKAREQLGWEPRIHPLVGLRQLLAWYAEEEKRS